MSKQFLEIETKYDGDDIDRLAFKALVRGLNPVEFRYVESRDKYYVKSEVEFLRHRMAPGNGDSRSELTFKKKSVAANNNVRTEVNLRIDLNSDALVEAFCTGLGYSFNFSIFKMCDIYEFEDANVVFYSVVPDKGVAKSFIEVEVNEELDISQEDAWSIILRYEKLLEPLGINHQRRLRKSLFEMYRRE